MRIAVTCTISHREDFKPFHRLTSHRRRHPAVAPFEDDQPVRTALCRQEFVEPIRFHVIEVGVASGREDRLPPPFEQLLERSATASDDPRDLLGGPCEKTRHGSAARESGRIDPLVVDGEADMDFRPQGMDRLLVPFPRAVGSGVVGADDDPTVGFSGVSEELCRTN